MTTPPVHGGDGRSPSSVHTPLRWLLTLSLALTGLTLAGCGDDGEADPDVIDASPTCDDGIQNGNETGVDCGGDCDPCVALCDPDGDDCLPAQRCRSVDAETYTCEPIRILALEEVVPSDAKQLVQPSTTVVTELLRELGASVTAGPGFHEWDGETPSLDDHDVLIWYQGYWYNESLGEDVQQIVADFVEGGGGLVRTEWAVYSLNDGAADVLLTMDRDSTPYTYQYGSVWTRAASGHAVGQSLPATFTVEEAGFSNGVLLDGATTIWSGVYIDDDASPPHVVPMVSSIDHGAGRIVHVNHDVLYSTNLDDTIIRILADSAIHAAR